MAIEFTEYFFKSFMNKFYHDEPINIERRRKNKKSNNLKRLIYARANRKRKNFLNRRYKNNNKDRVLAAKQKYRENNKKKISCYNFKYIHGDLWEVVKLTNKLVREIKNVKEK